MFRVEFGKSGKYCDGLSRRHFLQVGMAGMGSASLSQILHAKANAAQNGIPAERHLRHLALARWRTKPPRHL